MMKANRKRGFTLVEVLVAMVLMVIVASVFIPSMTFGFRNLIDSAEFTQDTFDYQQKIENLIEEKQKLAPTDPASTQTIRVFGKDVTGHIIRVNDKTSSDVTVFVPKNSVLFEVPIISAAPVIKVYNGATVVTPPSPLDMTDATLRMNVDDPVITTATKDSFLMYVYRWYLSSEMDESTPAPTTTKDYIAIKEWNEAKAGLTFAASNKLSFIPNIEANYNSLKMSDLMSGLSLTSEEWINQFGNRYVVYGVTPYSVAGRIGKEELSNKIYVKAPRIEIVSARFTTDDRRVDVLFNAPIGTSIDAALMKLNGSLGNIVSATRSATDSKVLILEFDKDLNKDVAVPGNEMTKGAVASEAYGKISIWSEGKPDGKFTIQPFTGLIANELLLNKSSITLDINQVETLIATLKPLGAVEPLKWESSVASVASVVDGTVTGLSVGTTTVRVSTLDNRLFATCMVNVVDIPTVLKAGYLKDKGHTGIKTNKLYVEFDEAITHVNLANDNMNHHIRLTINGITIRPTHYEICWDNPKAIILYFNTFDAGIGQLNIKGEGIKVNNKFSDVDMSIEADYIGYTSYRFHARSTLGTPTKYVKALTMGRIIQYEWNPNDNNQKWVIKLANNQNQPINILDFDASDRYNLINLGFDKYLERSSIDNQSSGQLLSLTNNLNSEEQRYMFDDFSLNGGYYKIVTNITSGGTSYVFDVHSNSTANGGASGNAGLIIRYTENNGNSLNQQFRFETVLELIE